MMLRNRSLAQRRSAFTLLEILIVVAIIVVVAGLGGMYLFGSLDNAKISTSKIQMKELVKVINEYRLDNGNNPPQSLEVLLQGVPQRDGAPYVVEEKALLDAWGNPFEYEYQDPRGPTLSFRTPNGLVVTNWDR